MINPHARRPKGKTAVGLLLVIGLEVLAGCASTANVADRLPPRSPSEVQVYARAPAGAVFVGNVKARGGDEADARTELNRQAARVGANGVIDVHVIPVMRTGSQPAIYQEDQNMPRTSTDPVATSQAAPPYMRDRTEYFQAMGTAILVPAER